MTKIVLFSILALIALIGAEVSMLGDRDAQTENQVHLVSKGG